MDDTEVPSMIVKNSEASNSYCGVAERWWLLLAISDKQQKRPISTLTTDHKTCMITGISRKYPICPIFSKVMLKFTENFSMTFAENRTYGVPEFAGTEVNQHSGKLKGLLGYLQNHYPRWTRQCATCLNIIPPKFRSTVIMPLIIQSKSQ